MIAFLSSILDIIECDKSIVALLMIDGIDFLQLKSASLLLIGRSVFRKRFAFELFLQFSKGSISFFQIGSKLLLIFNLSGGNLFFAGCFISCDKRFIAFFDEIDCICDLNIKLFFVLFFDSCCSSNLFLVICNQLFSCFRIEAFKSENPAKGHFSR